MDEVIAFIGLGSNLGDRKGNILRAIEMLNQQRAIHLRDVSTLAETQPIGPIQDQPSFMNGVVALGTTLKPLELLDTLLSVEERLGRVRKERWGPRLIDLDILIYGNETIHHPRLVVPHPEIQNRPFVMAGLKELGAQLPSAFSGEGADVVRLPFAPSPQPSPEKGKGGA